MWTHRGILTDYRGSYLDIQWNFHDFNNILTRILYYREKRQSLEQVYLSLWPLKKFLSDDIAEGYRPCSLVFPRPPAQTGILRNDFTTCGILLGVCFFPLGMLCCFLMMERRCSYCGLTFAWPSSGAAQGPASWRRTGWTQCTDKDTDCERPLPADCGACNTDAGATHNRYIYLTPLIVSLDIRTVTNANIIMTYVLIRFVFSSLPLSKDTN